MKLVLLYLSASILMACTLDALRAMFARLARKTETLES